MGDSKNSLFKLFFEITLFHTASGALSVARGSNLYDVRSFIVGPRRQHAARGGGSSRGGGSQLRAIDVREIRDIWNRR